MDKILWYSVDGIFIGFFNQEELAANQVSVYEQLLAWLLVFISKSISKAQRMNIHYRESVLY